ncbi:ABC-three component system protein [Grimontia marina]|uniref:ABC-three component systems C-terminal domain-containing protein n=1 Tax=Grimontia marina TaxID=646534 RepID=A0A128EZS4_9GAMM|nr:ABC-three component system protein [Grimontia marina]CZF79650.1 hypothetical protein GMA8713_01064 [Grimontia marina]
MTAVTEQIANSSAIPAWSGFVYQGKVALYHAIRLLVQGNSNAHYLKVETLEDFVIYANNHEVISLHQVKTMRSGYRSAYETALKQASKVVDRCNSRWFHVSVELDDVSDREANAAECEYLVQFYTYHDGRRYVETGSIDTRLTEIVTQYLGSSELEITSQLVEHKLAKLQMLLAARVNLAHHRNQHGEMTKFEAANSIPVYFSEIEECLYSEAIQDDDYDAILFKFRKTLLDRTDSLLDANQADYSLDLNDLCRCRHVIAGMEIERLTRLYYSKVPNQKCISLNGFSVNTVDIYLDIIAEIQGIRTANDLPHYFKSHLGTFLPTAMQFKRTNKRLNINDIQDNISGMRGNPVVQDVLYDYENLIVEMNSSPFKLSDQSISVGRFTDISEADKNRLTKINNVRFVSVSDASSEIND